MLTFTTAEKRETFRVARLTTLLAVVAFQGFATHTIGQGTEGANAASAPLQGARPILTAHGSRLAPIAPPPGRRVALTFDDGPTPQWTPQIARELVRAGVRGTFFVVGSQAARYPGHAPTHARQSVQLARSTSIAPNGPGAAGGAGKAITSAGIGASRSR